MTPLEQLARFVAARAEPPFDWVVEHCPHGTLDDVWRPSARHADNVARLELLREMSVTRRDWKPLWKKVVFAIVAADGVSVESRWQTEDGSQKFSTRYVETVLKVIPRIAREISQHRPSHRRLESMYDTIRRAAVNDACAERGAYNAQYQQTCATSGRCYHDDCADHVAHLDVARIAAYALAYMSAPADLIIGARVALSSQAIHRAILAAVPHLPMDILRSKT